MNRRTFFKLSAVAALGLAAFSVSHSARAADPSVAGTWELNVAKSKSTDPLPKSETRAYEVTGQQETMTSTGVNAQGQPTKAQFTAKTRRQG